MKENKKQTHVKPSLYAYYFEMLKDIAYGYGYNLVLHGSLNRDLDLIAIPWQEVLKSHDEMIREFANILGGEVLITESGLFTNMPHNRINYIININRGDGFSGIEDKQYYLDISVILS